MDRMILAFVVIFAGAFGGTYLLMRGGNGPTPPGRAAAARPSDDPSLAKYDAGKPSGAASAGDLDGDTIQGAAPSDDSPARAESTAPPGKPVPSPKPAARSARKPNTPRRLTLKRSPATPKPEQTSRGVWDPELKLLQGTWQIVDTEYNGNRLGQEGKDYSWAFRDGQYTIKYKGNFAELWNVQLNSAADPKTIDGTAAMVRKRLMGIYEVTGDTLKVCYDLTGNGRPDSFDAPAGSRRVCYYFKRQ